MSTQHLSNMQFQLTSFLVIRYLVFSSEYHMFSTLLCTFLKSFEKLYNALIVFCQF
jgi:hypothetical protein